MRRYLDLYSAFLLQQFKSYAEYRANFIIGASSTIMMQAANLLTVWVVMEQIPDFNGWSFAELLLIYGLITLAKSINHMFADNLWTVGRVYIRTGQFDRFLVRPIDPLFHLIADRFCYDGVGDFLVGVVLLGAAAVSLQLAWTPLLAAYILLAVLSGGAIFIALNLITCVSAFWIMDSVPVTRAIFDNHLFAQYPLTIYPKAVTTLLTWLIPYGFASFYPASYILGKDVGAYAWAGPAVAVVLLVIGYRVWQFGLHHYSGTGS
ncbi:MAG: ABC-2 family transporter protein [Anaerolineales bacterium]|nr:ABC-2 family transporter protein [Anaerolineales bacterium]